MAAFAVAMVLAASVVFWFLRWPLPDAARSLPLPMASDAAVVPSASDLKRLLGAPASAVQAVASEAASRFQLTGVVALGAGRGVAVVAMDGKPAKPYRVGSQLDAGWVLQSVNPRSATLGEQASGPERLTLELPRKQP